MRSFVTANSVLQRALTVALESERGLPLPWYEALNALQRAGGRVRVMDLAEHLVVSPSSLSRQLSRMEDNALIRRERGHLDDQRAVVAVLTRDGRDLWRRANTTYLRVAKKVLVNVMTDADVVAMQSVLDRVLGR